MTETRLQLSFLTENGKSFSLYVDNPKYPADDVAVKAAMDSIITNDVILGKNGKIVEIIGAKVITRTVEDVTLV